MPFETTTSTSLNLVTIRILDNKMARIRRGIRARLATIERRSGVLLRVQERLAIDDDAMDPKARKFLEGEVKKLEKAIPRHQTQLQNVRELLTAAEQARYGGWNPKTSPTFEASEQIKKGWG